MADSFLDNAGGFTPVPDKLVRDYGFEVAYVWGKVWRYCQMQNGACTASHETIAKRAGMSRRTLIDKLNILIEAGYIEDKTPGLKNKPHTYCTKKGEFKITSAMQISHTENDMSVQDNELGMRNLHSDDADNAQSDTPTMQNLHSSYANSAQPTMQNLHLKKDSLETIKETTPNGVGDKSPPGPKTKVKEAFEELTNLKTPTAKTEEKAWWGWYGQILEAGGKDADRAITIMGTVIKHMDASGLAINKPKSIVDSCRAVGAGRSLGRANGPLGENGTHPPNKASPALSAQRQEIARRLQAEDAKEIYNPLDRS